MRQAEDGYFITEDGDTEEELIQAVEHNTIHNQRKIEDPIPKKNKTNTIKPQITLPHLGKLNSTFIQEITPYLMEEQKIYYRPEEDGIIVINTQDQITTFKTLTPTDLVTYIEKFITPGMHVYNTKEKIWEFKPKSMTRELSQITLGSTQLKVKLPRIKTIYSTPQPILKEDKLTFPKRGYDPDLESYLPEFSPKIKEGMTLEEAKKTILDIYSEFCFKREQDKTNAIAALITPYLRGLYSRNTIRTPIFFYDANRERAGKDYCAAITGIVHYGEAIDETPLCDEKGSHDEEFRKKLLSAFKQGKRRFHSSNNKGYINSAELEAASTNENFTDRLLGSNTIATYQNTMEFSISANSGITYTPDLANRSVFIHLFLDVEDPNQRHFNKPDLHKQIREDREKIISALYTLVKNWYDKGMPVDPTPFSSFPEWAKVCGGIMTTAGLGDPCEPNEDAFNIGGDSETKDMKKLFELLYERYKTQEGNETEWIFKKQIMDLLRSDLPEDEKFSELFAWIDWTKPNGKVKFGKLFEKFVGRVFSDIRLIRQDNEKSERRTYQFVKTGGVGGVGGEFPPCITARDDIDIIYREYRKPPLSPHSPQKSDAIWFNCSKCDAPAPCYYIDQSGKPLCEICVDGGG